MKPFTLDDIKNSAVAAINPHLFPEKPLKYSAKEGKNIPKAKRGDKIKGWINLNLWHYCKANGLTLEREYAFHPERKWRFDWFIAELNCGIEYEGIFSEKSRHTSLSGYTGDAEKYSQAAILKIIVLRYTAKNYKNIIRDLEKIKI